MTVELLHEHYTRSVLCRVMLYSTLLLLTFSPWCYLLHLCSTFCFSSDCHPCDQRMSSSTSSAPFILKVEAERPPRGAEWIPETLCWWVCTVCRTVTAVSAVIMMQKPSNLLPNLVWLHADIGRGNHRGSKWINAFPSRLLNTPVRWCWCHRNMHKVSFGISASFWN